MDCLISSSCRMHKSFTPTENHSRLASHCKLKPALLVFPASKQDLSSLTCDWKCSEQTPPIRATSYLTQSGVHMQSVQTPCAKVALYASGLHAQEDVTCLRQSLISADHLKSRGSYTFVLSAGPTIINLMWFSSQFNPAPRPQTCPLINQTSLGFTARGRRLQCGNWRGENISHLVQGSERSINVHRACMISVGKSHFPRRRERAERVVSFVSSSPDGITRTLLDWIDLLAPWPSLRLQLCAYVISHWPWTPEMDSSPGPAVSQLPVLWSEDECKVSQISEKADFATARTNLPNLLNLHHPTSICHLKFTKRVFNIDNLPPHWTQRQFKMESLLLHCWPRSVDIVVCKPIAGSARLDEWHNICKPTQQMEHPAS